MRTRKRTVRQARPRTHVRSYAFHAQICGPVRVEVEGFRAASTDVLFLDMQPNKRGSYEPLIGYLVLEAIPAAADMLGHRLVPVTHFDLK